jgi:2-polyprenyl-3-methyl-5-hydroxy-6-metoxy-1,4-benzoquinol methylase
MKKKETVCLCMIAKNEEELILSCFNSVKRIVDEIILVDTGSRDGTAGLATGAGARVFYFDWKGDFARARNFALEQAVSDWILILDADEELEPVGPEVFCGLLHVSDVEGYFLYIKNYLGTGREFTLDQVVRLFRNRPEYRFEGAIHEQVAPAILRANGGKGLASAPLVINHCGYLDAQVVKKDKFARNTSILKRELKKKPGDPYLLHCLTVEYYQRGEVAKGVACLEKALGRMHGTEGYFQDALLNYALGLLSLGKTEKLIGFAGKSLEILPGHADLLLLRGIGYLGAGHYHEAAGDLERIFQPGNSEVLSGSRVLCFPGDVPHLAGLFREYAFVLTREIRAYAEIVTKGYDCGLLPVRGKLKFLVEELILLLFSEFWPHPISGTPLQVVFDGAAAARNAKKKSEAESEWNSPVNDPELSAIQSIIVNAVKVYPEHHDFRDIYRNGSAADCDRVFTERLKKNPSALKMSFWEEHFEIKAFKQYPEMIGAILDFGCGSGHADVYLAREGKRIHGIDMSPAGIAVAKYLRSLESAEVQSRLTFAVADVTRRQPEDTRYDSVWSSHVFEHIPDPGPVLAGLRKWALPGAYLLISVPMGYAYDDPGHLHHFLNAGQLKTHLEKSVEVLRVDPDEKNQVLRALCRFT